jgi:NAD(P)-dependent dehydrogenase (short-subunit alcohol dehydrogenase family)
VGALSALSDRVRIETLDLTDGDSIVSLGRRLADARIDLLFLNAGINPQHGAPLAATDYGHWNEVFRTNVIGPTRLAAALLDQVGWSDGKTIVAMGSMAGSFAGAMPGNYVYRTSKAALHSAMKALSIDLRDRGITVVVMHPGRVRTERTPDNPLDVAASVSGIRQVLQNLTPADSGKFFDYQGKELSW